MFSFVSMPFSLKIFWAPIVDSVYFRGLGRRRSWIIPIQMICGALLIYCASDVGMWLGKIPDPVDAGAAEAAAAGVITDGDGTGIPGAVGGNHNSSGANVPALTVFFIFQFFLMATQDIAVDGWALTLLSAKNVGYAMVCNSIGQSLGAYMSFNGLISFTDPVWCERHSKLIEMMVPWGGYTYTHGQAIVTLESFIRLVGWLFVASTALVLLKSESPEVHHGHSAGAATTGAGTGTSLTTNSDIDNQMGRKESELSKQQQHEHEQHQQPSITPTGSAANSNGVDDTESPESIAGALTAIHTTARQGLLLFSLPAVQLLCLVIITRKVGTAVVDASLSLKLQEYGMPKVDLMTFSTLSLVVSLVLPSFIKITKPLELWLTLYKCKLVLDMFAWLFFQFSASYYHQQHVNHTEGIDAPPLSWSFFLSFGVITVTTQVVNSLMFTCMGFFFNTIADSSIGGTYITLLNAVMNMGHLAPSSAVLYLMPLLTRTIKYVSTEKMFGFHHSHSIFQMDGLDIALLHVRYAGQLLRLNVAAAMGVGVNADISSLTVCTAVTAGASVVDSGMDADAACTATVVCDGFTTVVFLSTVLGVAWYLGLSGTIRRLQTHDKTRWTLAPPKQRDV